MKFTECIQGLLDGKTFYREDPDNNDNDKLYIKFVDNCVRYRWDSSSSSEWLKFTIELVDLKEDWKETSEWKEVPWYEAVEWSKRNPTKTIKSWGNTNWSWPALSTSLGELLTYTDCFDSWYIPAEE